MGILKYRLYDVDMVINRTLVYVALTATLAGVYVGSVIGLQAAFRTVTGTTSGLAVAVSTLVIVALFLPLRRRFQVGIDRRLYRRKYDAQKTLAAVAARLREGIASEALEAELLHVVYETVQPVQASVWQRPREAYGRP